MEIENKRFGLGVVLLVFNRQMTKLLMLKRNAAKRKKWGRAWGNVGGVVEFGEYTIDACAREAKEEANLDLDKKHIRMLRIKEHPVWINPQVHAVHFIYFTKIAENIKITINDESDECAWFAIDGLPEDRIDEDLGELINLAKKINDT